MFSDTSSFWNWALGHQVINNVTHQGGPCFTSERWLNVRKHYFNFHLMPLTKNIYWRIKFVHDILIVDNLKKYNSEIWNWVKRSHSLCLTQAHSSCYRYVNWLEKFCQRLVYFARATTCQESLLKMWGNVCKTMTGYERFIGTSGPNRPTRNKRIWRFVLFLASQLLPCLFALPWIYRMLELGVLLRWIWETIESSHFLSLHFSINKPFLTLIY